MPNCILRYCKNYSKKTKKSSEGITFHKFPRPGDEKREQWLKLIQNERCENTWFPSEHTCICSKHFREEDYYTTKTGRRYLKKCAVPFENLKGSEDKQHSSSTALKSDDSEEKIDETAEEGFAEEFNSGETDNSKKSPHDINNIKINYDNIDKFGKQIAFLLKRIPRQLCRELQEGIVTLVKTATKKYTNKTNVTASTSTITKKGKTPISQPALTPTLDTKPKADEEMSIEGPENISDKEETPVDETSKATQLRTSTNQSTSRIKTVPKPMVLPIEFFGSMDYIKQEILDPEDIAAEEQYSKATTSDFFLSDPLKTDIKIEIDETNLPKANRKENSRDKSD